MIRLPSFAAIVLSGITLLGAARVLAQQAEPIRLDGHLVHPTRILVRARTDVPVAGSMTAAEKIAQAGLMTLRAYRTMPGIMVLDVPRKEAARSAGPAAAIADPAAALKARIEDLQASGVFEYVEPDFFLTKAEVPTDARFEDGTLWGLSNTGQLGGKPGADINVLGAWDVTTGSTNTIVGVIDTGVMYRHRDLRDNMWVNPGEIPGNGVDDDNNGYIDDIHGINAITGSGDPMDDDGHGTHVAGTIGAVANNGFGHVGVAWTVRLMALKFLGTAGGFSSDAIECIDYSVNKKVKITNNSWGGGPFSRTLLDALGRARQAGQLFVVAAGNSGLDIDSTPVYPASYPSDNLLVVAALNRKDLLAEFSNYGFKTVHVGAPGVEIYSTFTGSDTAYEYLDGTSMASPHVAGVAALVLSAIPTADYAELKARIITSATQIEGLTAKTITQGRANASGAIDGKPDGFLEVSYTPQQGSPLLVNSTNNLVVRVTDLLAVTNAVVKAEASGSLEGEITFANDGEPPDVAAGDALYSAALVTTNLGELRLSFVVTAPGKQEFRQTVFYTVADRPAHDRFLRPVKLAATGADILDDNTLATLEAGEPRHAGATNVSASLWYSWPAASTGPVLVDLAGTAFDSVLAVYTGNGFSSLQTVAAVNDVGTRKSGYVQFNAVAGTTYRLVVASAGEAKGDLRLRVIPGGVPDADLPLVSITSHRSGQSVVTNRVVLAGTSIDPGANPSGIEEVRVSVNGSQARSASGKGLWSLPIALRVGLNTVSVSAVDSAENVSNPTSISIDYRPPPLGNDYYVNAVALSDTDGNLSANNTGATREPYEPPHAGSEGGRSIWYKFRAPADGLLKVNTRGSGIDTLLAIYQGERLQRAVALAANDDLLPGFQASEVDQAVEAGKEYHIAVDGFAGAVGQVRVIHRFTPTNIFRLTVNQTAGGTISPGTTLITPGQSVTLRATPQPGFRFVRWDGGALSYTNPLVIKPVANLSVGAVFRSTTLADDFESGNLTKHPYTTAGNAPWSVRSGGFGGSGLAAGSGATPDGGSSALGLRAKTWAGAGSFQFRVSSEAGWDFLEFYLNGSLLQRWSGEVGWTLFSFPVSEGVNQLEWRYVKDGQTARGSDEAFIDNLILPIQPPVGPASPAELSLLSVASSRAEVRLVGQLDQRYVIEGSTNLSRWAPISTNIAVDGEYVIRDPVPANRTERFYRAVVR
ncbi:MAG: S8 family serine peptidase [Verrucomicrobiota bacterium]